MRFEMIFENTVMVTLGKDELMRWRLTPENVSINRLSIKNLKYAENNKRIISITIL